MRRCIFPTSRSHTPLFALLPLALALLPLGASATTTTCGTVAACVLGKNTANGPGVEGTSVTNFGLAGISKSSHGVNGSSSTSFGVVGMTYQNATTPNTARAGVYGTDNSTNNGIYNSGVAGLSRFGIGTLGETTTGVAVEGLAVGDGAFVSKPKYSSIGVYGDADFGPGVYGYAHGTTTDSYGVGAQEDEPGRPAFFADSAGDGGGGIYSRTHTDGYIMIGTTFESGDVFSVDGNGNEILSGTLTTNGSPLVRTHRSAGSDVTTFGERSSTPTMEDMGEATLVRGEAYVALDSTFAAAIDPRSKYLVFLTPEGDSHGLFIAAQSGRGFAVHENGGARSTLAFNYRIVAKPYDTSARRMPALNMRPQLQRSAVTGPAARTK